jgi:hypothetical protein
VLVGCEVDLHRFDDLRTEFLEEHPDHGLVLGERQRRRAVQVEVSVVEALVMVLEVGGLTLLCHL